MKLVRRVFLSIAALYAVFWLGLAAYFSFAERHKGLLEANLSAVFDREVTIQSVTTEWNGLSPSIQINQFNVPSNKADQTSLAFESLSAEISPLSLLIFWPKFTKFAIERPQVEIVSLPENKFQVAGTKLKSNRSKPLNLQRLLSWLLNHQSAVWLNGEVVWQRLDGELHRYSDISFVYDREQQNRSISAAAQTPKGALAFKAKANGDVIKTNNWDASLEVLGNKGQRLLSPDDLSLVVDEGQGQLTLKKLNVERIRDFLRLTGIVSEANWVLRSELSGRLHDVQFNFSGPLFGFTDWSLNALASEVAFESVGPAPAMSNLEGKLTASTDGGSFEFATQAALFDWPRWFDQPFPIDQAMGQFEWAIAGNGKVSIQLTDGAFNDKTVALSKLNAKVELDTNTHRVSNFAELFKVSSVADLSYQDGAVVRADQEKQTGLKPLFLDASAQFEVVSLAEIERYFPKDPRMIKFHKWWKNAFVSGHAKNGRISYQGEVSKNAVYVGKGQLSGQADVADVALNYGYPRLEWPKLTKGRGVLSINNALVTILPDEAWLGEDQVRDAKLEISSVFRLDRTLNLQASLTTDVPKVMDFLFAGPLLKKDNIPEELPIKGKFGVVNADINVDIPLAKVRNATVKGSAIVSGGSIVLPSGIPVNNIKGDVTFTERSAESNNITAQFLGGRTRATLTTTEASQPPKLKLTAKGNAKVSKLEPWVGEHLLSWIDGSADWRGTVLIDGPKVNLQATSDLLGVDVTAPAPLNKSAQDKEALSLSMQVGAKQQQRLTFKLGDTLNAVFAGDLKKNNQLLDRSIISVNTLINQASDTVQLKPGINFDISGAKINLDDWITAIIDLATLKTKTASSPVFLDAMRKIDIKVDDPFLLGRKFGAVDFSAVSVDGHYWIGSLNGDNVTGTLRAQPRESSSSYLFNLSKLHLVEEPKTKPVLAPIDQGLQPSSYPIIEINANSFRLAGKNLGRLALRGEPEDNAWKLSKFSLEHQGVSTTASGQWVNNSESGTMSSFDIETVIDEAGGVLTDMDFDGVVKKGDGRLRGNLNWIGAPHEFDYSRLNGNFDLKIENGELIKVEPGSGKLLGLLNFNAIARRLTLDFRDIFSTGLQFDQMRYSGVFAEGEAIMREAYVFTPAVFVRMEGKLDLHKELIDMEMHVSPELGGNLTLLSALANPAAGAVVFLTQQIFKDEMRAASFQSYRALGTWEDFELTEFNPSDDQSESSRPPTPLQSAPNENTASPQ